MGAFMIEVVDGKGGPLEGVEVAGSVDVNPGPVGSTCCSKKRFAVGKTAENGRVLLSDAPFTYRGYHFRTAYRDWPQREVDGTWNDGRSGPFRIVLGPAREVRGRVELVPDCELWPNVEVSASTGERAPIAADGSFVFENLPPWAYIWVYACGRGGRAELTVGDDQPVTLPMMPSRTH
jgi:hypothetical protein